MDKIYKTKKLECCSNEYEYQLNGLLFNVLHLLKVKITKKEFKVNYIQVLPS